MVFLRTGFERRQLHGQMVYFVAWVLVTGIGVWLTPSPRGYGTHTQLGLWPCLAKIAWNRPCPACGLTTSWTALLHGNLPLALHAHWLGPFLYLLFSASALLAGYGYLRGLWVDTSSPLLGRYSIGVLVIVLVYGAVRFVASYTE